MSLMLCIEIAFAQQTSSKLGLYSLNRNSKSVVILPYAMRFLGWNMIINCKDTIFFSDYSLFRQKSSWKVANLKKKHYLCTRNEEDSRIRQSKSNDNTDAPLGSMFRLTAIRGGHAPPGYWEVTTRSEYRSKFIFCYFCDSASLLCQFLNEMTNGFL